MLTKMPPAEGSVENRLFIHDPSTAGFSLYPQLATEKALFFHIFNTAYYYY